MLRRTLGIALAALALAGCIGHDRLARVERLPDEDKELYAKYKQFLTEDQQDEFLELPSSYEREQYIAALHIEERLARYPQYIQDAIWQQQVVPGMDAEAVLLTWSTPFLREWDEAERSRGNDVERWNYRRFDQYVQVVFANGVVTQVVQAEGEH